MFNLEPTSQYTLSNPPLAQALAQVRFPLLAKIHSLDGVAVLQEALSKQFPYMQRVVEASVIVGSSGVDAQPEHSVAWHFTDDEERLLVVGSSIATLSVGGQYVGIADFAARFEEILHTLRTVYSIRRCDQVGVRFLDLVTDGGDDVGQWRRWFNGNVVGWAASEIVHGEAHLQAAVSQIQLVSPPVNELSVCPSDVQVVVRHGVAPVDSVLPGIPPTHFKERSFFLDIDVFVASPQDFDVASIGLQFRAMHSQIDRFFRWTLTEEGEKYFGLQEKE